MLPERDLGGRAVGRQHRRGVVAALEAGGVPGLADLVDDEQVAALAGQLRAAVGEHVGVVVAGLGGEPDEHLAGAPARRRARRRMSGFCTSSTVMRVGLLALGVEASAGR